MLSTWVLHSSLSLMWHRTGETILVPIYSACSRCIDSTARAIFLFDEAVNSSCLVVGMELQLNLGQYKPTPGLLLQLLEKKEAYYWCCQVKMLRCIPRTFRNQYLQRDYLGMKPTQRKAVPRAGKVERDWGHCMNP